MLQQRNGCSRERSTGMDVRTIVTCRSYHAPRAGNRMSLWGPTSDPPSSHWDVDSASEVTHRHN